MIADIMRAKTGDQVAFAKISSVYQPYIDRMCAKFARDRYVKRIQSEEDLKNIALVEVWSAINEFKHDPAIPDDENEKKFSKLTTIKVKNALCDEIYRFSHIRRGGGMNSFSVDSVFGENDESFGRSVSLEDTHRSEDADKFELSDYFELFAKHIGKTELTILRMRIEGRTNSEIAAVLGMKPDKVANISYYRVRLKLQPIMREQVNGRRARFPTRR